MKTAMLYLVAFTGTFTLVASVLAQPAKDADWARVTEYDRAIKIETDKLAAVIPKKNHKHWMTGIGKQSFLDKTTGFREVGDTAGQLRPKPRERGGYYLNAVGDGGGVDADMGAELCGFHAVHEIRIGQRWLRRAHPGEDPEQELEPALMVIWKTPFHEKSE